MKVSSVLLIVSSRSRLIILFAFALLLAAIPVRQARAEVIDRIEINQVGEEARIQIKFISRIQYLRHATLKNGDVRIYFNLLEIDALDPRLTHETKDSPPSKIAPHFTVTYPELDSSLTVRFSDKVTYRLLVGRDGRSFVIYTPALKPASQPAPKSSSALPVVPVVLPVIVPPVSVPGVPFTGKATPSASQVVAPTPVPAKAETVNVPLSGVSSPEEEVEQEAKQLIDSARNALKQGQGVAAIDALNRLLNLPPNQQSQSAQALIGEAREKLGEFSKARVEYELYLKLYPNAKEVKRVRELLARLPKEKTRLAEVESGTAQKKVVAEEKMTVFGSLSQDYSKGISYTDSSSFGGPVATLSVNDQSQLVSTLDLTGRKRTETTDTRLVLRDTHTANFLPGHKVSSNRLNTAYIEQSARDRHYRYRLGRQTGMSGGLPGRFDGGLLSYSLNPTWRVNGVIGTPVEFTGSGGDKKSFIGMSVDLNRAPEQWSGSSYFIEQRVAGVTDRRAVGVEARYFDPQQNYSGLLEYDTLFKAINIAMFQGNWTAEAGSNYFMLADHRKSPPLQLSNALPGQVTQSIDALIQSGVSMKTLLGDAQALSAISDLIMIGMSHPYSPRFQLGGDVRMTNTSGTKASGTLPASPGTGNSYIYTVQAVGNNLLLENDLGVASFSYINAQSYKGKTYSFSQVETFRQRWRLDFALQLYSQKDNLGVNMARLTPSLKLSYRMNDSISFEGEGGLEDTHTYSATQDEKIRRTYFNVGYRWDF